MFRDYAVADFIVLGFRDDPAPHKIVGIVVGAIRNDPVGIMFGHSRQVQQILAGGFVDVNGFTIPSHPIFDSLHDRFGVAPHGLSRFRGASADFVGIVSVVVRARRDAREQTSERDNPERTYFWDLHGLLMRDRHLWLAPFLVPWIRSPP
jgi:hypothetical protein